MPLVGVGHGEQLVGPHEVTDVSRTHWPLQRWLPNAQVKPQLVPSQVAVALAGGTHGVQLEPQEFVDASETH